MVQGWDGGRGGGQTSSSLLNMNITFWKQHPELQAKFFINAKGNKLYMK
jgi:hypothetical protein